MNDWATSALGEIGRVVTGKTSPTANSRNYGGAIPFVTPTDMDGRRTISRTLRSLSDEGLGSVRSSYVSAPAIAVSCIGSDMGKSVLIYENYVSNQQINSLCPSSEHDLLYLYYNLAGRREEIRGLAGGAAQPILNKSDFSRLQIQIPPLQEQRAIGIVLSSLDDKIELNQRMNETLEGMAQAVFRDWFVDFGPVRRKQAGASDPIQVMGALTSDPAQAAKLAALFPGQLSTEGPPEGWKIGSFNALAQSVGESVHPSSFGPETLYIGLEHMPRRSIALDSWEFAEKVSSQKSKFSRGQVLFGKLRPYFHKVGIAPTDGVCSTDIVVLDSRKSFDRALVACCASSDAFVAFTDQSSTGTKMPRTSWGHMKAFELAVADEAVREAFSELVQPLHERILAATGENRTLAETRDYILPRLMSGAVRVDPARNATECTAP